jgi:hypothetical protein
MGPCDGQNTLLWNANQKAIYTPPSISPPFCSYRERREKENKTHKPLLPKPTRAKKHTRKKRVAPVYETEKKTDSIENPGDAT